MVNDELLLALSAKERLERLEIAYILGDMIKGERLYNLGKPGVVWDGVLYPPETMDDYKAFSKLDTDAERMSYIKAHVPWQYEFVAKQTVCD